MIKKKKKKTLTGSSYETKNYELTMNSICPCELDLSPMIQLSCRMSGVASWEFQLPLDPVGTVGALNLSVLIDWFSDTSLSCQRTELRQGHFTVDIPLRN